MIALPGNDDLDRHPVATDRGIAGRVPVIDLAGASATDEIATACRDWGFFQVTGHGVPQELLDEVWQHTRRFFARPQIEKDALTRDRDNPWGYYNNELTKNRRDRKEVFDFTTDGSDPIYAGHNRWPADAAFRSTMSHWLGTCVALSFRLLEHMGRGLGLEPGYLARYFEPSHTGFVRLNHYPVADPRAAYGDAIAAADLGVHHHTDAGALTVLLQDPVGGLQVHRDGFWHDVAPRADAFVINTADMLQVWSNDRYVAPVHRVLAMQAEDRYSLPFFFNPAAACTVEPLAAIPGTDTPHYRQISWAEFRGRRTQGDYADYGPEVQISQYRIQ